MLRVCFQFNIDTSSVIRQREIANEKKQSGRGSAQTIKLNRQSKRTMSKFCQILRFSAHFELLVLRRAIALASKLNQIRIIESLYNRERVHISFDFSLIRFFHEERIHLSEILTNTERPGLSTFDAQANARTHRTLDTVVIQFNGITLNIWCCHESLWKQRERERNAAAMSCIMESPCEKNESQEEEEKNLIEME